MGEWLQKERPDKSGFRVKRHTYAGRRDELVTFTLSSAFGGRLAIQTSAGGKIVEIARTDTVRPVTTIEVKLPVEGRYTLLASARSPGIYTLRARSAGSISAVDWAMVYPARGNPDESYALLVGVNDYPGSANDLSGGPLVDVEIMRHLLVEKFGYSPHNVLVLRDEEGNREQVVEAFRRHLGQAGPNGSALFYYSGHGMQLKKRPAAAGDRESDDRDEALSLWGTQEELYGYLLDDELGVLIDELKTGRALVILDDCNSGTATRGMNGIKWRDVAGSAPVPPVIRRMSSRQEIPPIQLKSMRADDVTSQLENPALHLRPNPQLRKKDHILLAASDDSEQTVSVEMQLDDGTSVQVGVFTILLFQTLMPAGESMTFESLIREVRPKVMATSLKVAGRPQTVQISGGQARSSIRAFLSPAR